MNKYKKYKRRAFLQRQSFRFNANLHRLRCRRIVIEAILREKRHQGFQKRKLEKEQKKAAKHPISLTVPQDFRLLVTCADGTAMQCGRVGSRLLLSRASDFERFLRLFCFHAVLLSYRSFIPQITRLLLSFYLFGPGFCKCV